MQKDKRDIPQGKGVGAFGTVAAGIAGAAIGAAAVALSDKRNRQKITKAVGDVAEKGKKAVNELRQTVEDKIVPKAKELRNKGEEVVKEGKEKAEDELSSEEKR
ncbi:MAG: hypothetical protein Q8P26_03970 [Candidatus Levybacteria bacterium]|nr:hypothetical protein [Candidatus Levybacteria bacterium]